jgi:hypothetical protein
MDPVIEIGLARIRQHRRHVWIVFAGYLPVVGSIGLALRALGVDSKWPGMIAAFAYMALWLGIAGRVTFADCPRCGELFHGTLFFINPWARKCWHCGLSLRHSSRA